MRLCSLLRHRKGVPLWSGSHQLHQAGSGRRQCSISLDCVAGGTTPVDGGMYHCQAYSMVPCHKGHLGLPMCASALDCSLCCRQASEVEKLASLWVVARHFMSSRDQGPVEMRLHPAFGTPPPLPILHTGQLVPDTNPLALWQTQGPHSLWHPIRTLTHW